MTTPLRVGLIGLVSAYSLHYAEDLSRHPDVRLVGTAHLGRDPQYIRDSLELPWLKAYPKTVEAYAARWDVPVVETADELYDRGVDAVVVCTEDALRTRYAVEALGRGVHVLLPKPFASSLAEVQALRAALAGSPATLTPSLPLRWSGLYAGAKRLLDEGAVGAPVAIRGQVAHHLTFGPWKSDPALAAGPEFEVGFYTLDALCYLMAAAPARVYAAARNVLHTGVPTFDVAKVLVEFDGGGLGSADFYCGNHFAMPSQEMEIVATDGAIRIERDAAAGAPALKVYTAGGERTERPPAAFRPAELANWVRICRAGDRAAADALLAAGTRTLEVLLAFRQSWTTGARVDLPLPGVAAGAGRDAVGAAQAGAAP